MTYWRVPTIEDRLRHNVLLFAQFPDALWRFETIGTEEVVGRSALRIRANRTSPRAQDEPNTFGVYSDITEFELLVDEELRLLMAMTAQFEHKTVAEIRMTELSLDAKISPDFFEFTPPAGTRIVHMVP